MAHSLINSHSCVFRSLLHCHTHAQAQHRYELVELEAFQLMCSGLVRLLVGLRVAGE